MDQINLMTSATLVENGAVRLKQTRHGLMLYNIHDMYLGRCLDLYGEYSRGEYLFLSQVVRPGMTVLDIGANIGAHTLWMAQAVGPAGTVWAFEPQRVVHQMLCANLALNNLGNVRALHLGVGRKAGKAAIPPLDYGRGNNFGGIALREAGRGEDVPVITVDSLNLTACHVAKIDVEGMEGDVLAGAKKTIEKHRPVLYVENDRRDKSPALIKQLWALGYTLYWHLPPLVSSDNFFGNQANVFPGTVSVNLVCLPKEAKPIEGQTPVADAEEHPMKR
ncbi:MAG: FkbM family methyltransferase [Solirubrobacterales bacterium]